MARADVFDIEKNKVSEIELSDDVFGAEVNEATIYDVVKMQLASRRSGTAQTKERCDVQGGGKKPWRQKGTGRARAGTSRSPVWRAEAPFLVRIRATTATACRKKYAAER